MDKSTYRSPNSTIMPPTRDGSTLRSSWSLLPFLRKPCKTACNSFCCELSSALAVVTRALTSPLCAFMISDMFLATPRSRPNRPFSANKSLHFINFRLVSYFIYNNPNLLKAFTVTSLAFRLVASSLTASYINIGY